MEVEGTANGVFVGFDVQAGDFYARESKDFHIEGTILSEFATSSPAELN